MWHTYNKLFLSFTGGQDYQVVEGETIKFEVEETRKDLSIIIVDDEALEELEYFNVSIRAVPGAFPVVVKNSQALVEIVDNDCEHAHTHM